MLFWFKLRHINLILMRTGEDMRVLGLCFILCGICTDVIALREETKTFDVIQEAKAVKKEKNLRVNQLVQTINEGTLVSSEAFEGEVFDTTNPAHKAEITYCLDYSNVKRMVISVEDFQYLSNTKLKTCIYLELLEILNFEDRSLDKQTIEKIDTLLFVAKKLKYLKFSQVNLKQIPQFVGQLKYLQELSIEDDSISQIPENIKNLKRLRRLTLKSDKLMSIPEEIGCLSNLEHLYIRGDNIKRLPEKIGDLENLIYLDLHCKNLEEVPERLKNLTELKYLDCIGCKFTNIPKRILNDMNCRYMQFSSESSIWDFCLSGFDSLKKMVFDKTK